MRDDPPAFKLAADGSRGHKSPEVKAPLQSVGLAQRRGGDNDDVRNAPGQDVVQSHAFSHITTQQGTRHYLTTGNLPLSSGGGGGT